MTRKLNPKSKSAHTPRYSTYDEAGAGHNRIVQMLKLTVDK